MRVCEGGELVGEQGRIAVERVCNRESVPGVFGVGCIDFVFFIIVAVLFECVVVFQDALKLFGKGFDTVIVFWAGTRFEDDFDLAQPTERFGSGVRLG